MSASRIRIAMTQIDDVKSRLDIVELVSGYVNLQRSGSSLKANCPFHQERTPSFFVFPDRQSWRCFGSCAEGGDAFSFLMKADQVDFREALHRLAARVGVVLQDQRESGGISRQLFEINEAARLFYHQILTGDEGAGVRDYLHHRGITDRSIQTFELGCSPARNNRLLAHLTGQGYPAELIVQAGLARESDDGRLYDLFRGRLMIPIRDWQARVAGFGSRALDENATAKYINTPRTPVFDKSRILFALHLGKEPIRQQGAVIVEGYMDTIMAHQNGFDNVVASMGTALTADQVTMIRRLTNRVTMAMDGDPAGRNATLRSLESSWGVFQQRNARQTTVSALQQPETLELRVAELPPGQDPDDFIRHSPAAWPDFVAGAQELFDYLLASLSQRANMDDVDGRSWVAQVMLRFVAQIPDPIKRDLYVDRLAARLGLNGDTLRAAMPGVARPASPARGQRADGNAPAESAARVRDHDATEEYLLALCLQYGQLLAGDAITAVPAEWFSRSENREIYRSVLATTPGSEVDVLPELQPHLTMLQSRKLRLSTTAKVESDWRRTLLRVEKGNLKKEIQDLYVAMAGEEIGDHTSPVASRLLNNAHRINEIDKLLMPSTTTRT